ncbi:MAG: hypothetical protein H0A76_12700 [Candidatus Thiodubiliella endoseptemdiera]|uniref:Transposase n=1 Tax=Candidatus Thiodubiliella endoseptemdiera TaxID=2738886 RepID=A0A853F6F2_9GAMM|nr:hypothetical protein [Candidatus Thiodubiliella endoseptemdiera]
MSYSISNKEKIKGDAMRFPHYFPRQQQVLLHSDQGSTYRAYEYLALFKANNITQRE